MSYKHLKRLRDVVQLAPYTKRDAASNANAIKSGGNLVSDFLPFRANFRDRVSRYCGLDQPLRVS